MRRAISLTLLVITGLAITGLAAKQPATTEKPKVSRFHVGGDDDELAVRPYVTAEISNRLVRLGKMLDDVVHHAEICRPAREPRLVQRSVVKVDPGILSSGSRDAGA